jgi:hypothetical protein
VISIPSNTKHLCIGKNNRKLIDPLHLVPSNDIHYLYTENCDIYYQIQQQCKIIFLFCFVFVFSMTEHGYSNLKQIRDFCVQF